MKHIFYSTNLDRENYCIGAVMIVKSSNKLQKACPHFILARLG